MKRMETLYTRQSDKQNKDGFTLDIACRKIVTNSFEHDR